MKKTIVLVILFFVLINIVFGETEEEKLKKTARDITKDSLIEIAFYKTNLSSSLGSAVNNTNPILYGQIQRVCKVTYKPRLIVYIIGLASAVGLIKLKRLFIGLGIGVGLGLSVMALLEIIDRMCIIG